MATKFVETPMLSLMHSQKKCTAGFKSTKFSMHSFALRQSPVLKDKRIHCSSGQGGQESSASSVNKVTIDTSCDERMKELKKFDESKAGVKGLLDSGMTKVPPIFICPPEPTSYNPKLSLPVIDIQGFDGERRREIVEEIGNAMEIWGGFQMVNHGIPMSVMKAMLDKIREFHELPQEVKRELYSRDYNKSTKLYATADLFITKTAQWKDTLSCDFQDGVASDVLPPVCGKVIEEYMKLLVELIKDVVSELMSEALGIDRKHLLNMGCFESQRLTCHYYPPCPQPHLTQGVLRHTDPYFLTVVLQDHIGGLQVFQDNQWLDVSPVEGALVVNGGDFLQLITNDKFNSPEHRVVAREIGPRISAPCFFMPSKANGNKPFGPIKEILSEKNPPKYKETGSYEYREFFYKDGVGAGMKEKALKQFQRQNI